MDTDINKTANNCIACEAELEANAVFCNECGAQQNRVASAEEELKLQSETKQCPQCGVDVLQEMKFCTKCAFNFSSVQEKESEKQKKADAKVNEINLPKTNTSQEIKGSTAHKENSMNYFVFKNEQNNGPFSENEISAKLRSGEFSTEDLVCREGESEWKPMNFFFPFIQEEKVQQPYEWMSEPGVGQSGTNPPINQQTPSMPNQQRNQPFPNQQSGFNMPQQDAPISALPQQNNVQHVVHHFEKEPEGAIPMIGLIGGIVIFCMMVVGLVPCLGWINWFVLFFGSIVKIVGWVGVFTSANSSGKTKSLVGLVLVTIAIFIGFIRLILGGGVF